MFFTNVSTLEELKKQYHKLAKQYHPDIGGDTATMQAITNEYEMLFNKVKNTFRNMKGETYTKENNETASQFVEIIAKLMKMEGIAIEIIGTFIWLSGNTREHIEEIKSLGFAFHTSKKVWYLAPRNWTRRGRKNYSLNDIRRMYGSQYISKNQLECGYPQEKGRRK